MKSRSDGEMPPPSSGQTFIDLPLLIFRSVPKAQRDKCQ